MSKKSSIAHQRAARKGTYLSVVLFVWASVAVFAQKGNYYFRCLNTENGLSQNTVLSILQDRTGFMWFGTKDGLNKYDGNSVKVYKYNEQDPYSLGNNTVWSLLELPDGIILVGTDRGIYQYNPSTDHFCFFDKKTDGNMSITGSVLDMKLDRQGYVWISCHNLYKYSTETGRLEIALYAQEEYEDDKTFLSRTWSVNIDKDNQVWISLLNGGLKKYNPQTGQFYSYNRDASGGDLRKSQISYTVNVGNNKLLIGAFNDKLKVLDKTAGGISDYLGGETFADSVLFVRTMNVFSDRNVWIGTESGLYIHNPETKHTTHLTHHLNDRYSLSDNVVYSMYEDREGGIWIGTYFGGVNYYPLPYAYFYKYYPIPGRNSLSGERVSGLCEDKEGHLWIGTEDGGLSKLCLDDMNFEQIKCGLNYHNVHDIILDDDRLWIATYSQGINVLDLKTGQWKYYKKGEKDGMLNNNDIFALYKDTSGCIWVGTSTGLFQYDRVNDSFVLLSDVNNKFVSDIIEDGAGQIWIATYNSGVYCYNPRTKECRNYNHDMNDPQSICYHKITCMYLDMNNRLWFGSESNGICMFDERTGSFVRYGLQDGFSNNMIYKILEDDSGNLWLSSNSGLMRFDPETKQIRIFTQNNGLPSNQFNYKSGYKDKKGRLYFGSLNGLVTFRPSDFIQNNHVPPVVITDFKLLNNESLLNAECRDMENILLKHNQSSFSIDFAALSYVAPEMNKYAYKMEGLENDWNYLSVPQKIIYSNLPYGKYVFRVKAANNDGLWNERGDSLAIIINPPFWRTTWAYLLYVMLVLFFVVAFFNYYIKKIERDNMSKRQLFESEKEKEIYDSKIEFFTNIAHEIRTPLTLIKGPLEYIMKHEVGREELKNNLFVMEKNTNRLLSLINQLLDFRKTESKGFSLTFTNENMNELLSETFVRFEPLAKQKGLTFELLLPDKLLLADIDREAITKVISNLFTNAIKYARNCIKTELTEEGEKCCLKVYSDGKRIPEEIKEKIFEPFFQAEEEQNKVKSGSGIGLALVRSLVELHGGVVYLDVKVESFNAFVVVLPKKQEKVFEMIKETCVDAKKTDRKQAFTEENLFEKKETSNLLLVDDNEELLQFLQEKLNEQYVVFQARNGVEALNVLKKEIVHLIVSDIMMPQMDGFELCSYIKNNAEFSHIPIILLTAKTNVQSKIVGLESGADAYIEKPFSIEHLWAQISNLLNSRRKMREAFANSPFVHTGSIAMNKSDEQFLNKLTDMVQINISNADFNFNVDHLAEELCMSRSSLLRKIKSITGVTPNDFIRLIRLKKAAEILQEGEYKVNEVCYLVGFSSISYFTKAFQKQFGMLPRDFIKEVKKKNNADADDDGQNEILKS